MDPVRDDKAGPLDEADATDAIGLEATPPRMRNGPWAMLSQGRPAIGNARVAEHEA
jgi:hypothetical protein